MYIYLGGDRVDEQKTSLPAQDVLPEAKCLTAKDLDNILNQLTAKRERKKEIALAKAQAEIQTIQREADAYWDGLYDAIRAVKNLLP